MRKVLPGILLVDCGGIPKMYRIVSQLMRQIIVNVPALSFPKLVAIADADRFGIETLFTKVDEYIKTPCKAHNLEFTVTQTGERVSLRETKKNRAIGIECQLVPESLESQTYKLNS